MPVLTDIPFSLDTNSLMARLRVAPESGDARALDELVRLAERIGNPKAVYREGFIEAGDSDTIRVDGVTFTSRMLSRNLSSVERVFAFVATCGREVHEACPTEGDLVKDFWWDTIKDRLLMAARTHLTDHFRSKYRLGRKSTMSPGAGDAAVWPIEQQARLFALIGDVRGQIGVELTDSFLMVPNKTVSGITFPTEVDFRSCQVCRREGCPSRSGTFDERLWREVQGD